MAEKQTVLQDGIILAKEAIDSGKQQKMLEYGKLYKISNKMDKYLTGYRNINYKYIHKNL